MFRAQDNARSILIKDSRCVFVGEFAPYSTLTERGCTVSIWARKVGGGGVRPRESVRKRERERWADRRKGERQYCECV